MTQPKNIKRAMSAQGRAALDNRQGSRTSRVDPRRVRGGRTGAQRRAIQEGQR